MDDIVTGTYALYRLKIDKDGKRVIVRGRLQMSLQTLIVLTLGVQLKVTFGTETIPVLCTDQKCDLIVDPNDKVLRGTEVNLTLKEV